MRNQDREKVAEREKTEACQMKGKVLIQVLMITTTNGFVHMLQTKPRLTPICDATTQTLTGTELLIELVVDLQDNKRGKQAGFRRTEPSRPFIFQVG